MEHVVLLLDHHHHYPSQQARRSGGGASFNKSSNFFIRALKSGAIALEVRSSKVGGGGTYHGGFAGECGLDRGVEIVWHM